MADAKSALPYPPRRAMLALIALIENELCVLRDDDRPHLLIGTATVAVARMELDDAHLLADRGYLDLTTQDGVVGVTDAGQEWAAKWCRNRLGREIRPKG